MKYETFEKQMNIIKEIHETIDQFVEFLSESKWSKLSKILDDLISSLNEEFSLKLCKEFGSIIDHYVYESKFGKIYTEVFDEEGNIIDNIITIKDLYRQIKEGEENED